MQRPEQLLTTPTSARHDPDSTQTLLSFRSTMARASKAAARASNNRGTDFSKVLLVSQMNRARLDDARAAVKVGGSASSNRREKNRLSALASRQRMLDETASLVLRVLDLESRLGYCKSRLSRYESVDDLDVSSSRPVDFGLVPPVVPHHSFVSPFPEHKPVALLFL